MSDEPQWEEIISRDYMLRPSVDQVRCRHYDGIGWWSKWSPWQTIESARTIGDFVGTSFNMEWQFRRPKQDAAESPEPQPKPDRRTITVDRGERYQRRIHQSIDGPGKDKSIIVDIADICEAFQLPYMLAQAVKKIMLPGERGSKDRLKDLREAAWHIQRQIQIEEAKTNGAV